MMDKMRRWMLPADVAERILDRLVAGVTAKDTRRSDRDGIGRFGSLDKAACVDARARF